MRHHNPDYAAMIQTLDENVGASSIAERYGRPDARRVHLRQRRQVGWLPAGDAAPDNAPLRSGKGSLYEGGIRVPLLVRLPGLTAPGTVCHEPVICMDLWRTMAELAGVAGDTGLDGLSLAPLLRNPRPGWHARRSTSTTRTTTRRPRP